MAATDDTEQQILTLLESSIEDARIPEAIAAHADKRTGKLVTKTDAERRLVHESDRALRELRLDLKVLRRNIDTALERLDAGGQVNAHLIANAAMITEQIARWNLVRDLLPMVTEES